MSLSENRETPRIANISQTTKSNRRTFAIPERLFQRVAIKTCIEWECVTILNGRRVLKRRSTLSYEKELF